MAPKIEGHTDEERKRSVERISTRKTRSYSFASTKTSPVNFLGSSTFLCKTKKEDFFVFCKYSSPQLSMGDYIPVDAINHR